MKRYVDNPDYSKFVQSAKDYVDNAYTVSTDYLFTKPYDLSPGHLHYFQDMYAFMNLFNAMPVSHQGRILDVGSGPGWTCEIMASLGYRVDAIEPSEAFIRVARQRLEALHKHHPVHGQVEFHQCTLEECTIQNDTFDAAVFYASLHHVVDEKKCLDQVFRMLKPGGILGISEGAWFPGSPIEKILDKEMEEFHTLESPFTTEYLDRLLTDSGFTNIVRYCQINGLFTAAQGERTIRLYASELAESSNIVTAIKPWPWPTTLDAGSRAAGTIDILEQKCERQVLKLKLKLINTGKVAWLHTRYAMGYVTVTLHQGNIEAPSRVRLPETVLPGKDLTIDIEYELPRGKRGPWFLDLINEEYYWFGIDKRIDV